jgi:Uma2 family endonuclease
MLGRMVTAAPIHVSRPPRTRPRPTAEVEAEPVDQRFAMYGVSWDEYVALNDALGDRGGVRVCYCEGTLELMSPGLLHEDKKTRIARLLELYGLVRDVPLHGLGSMTYRKQPRDRGAEPDECYYVGKVTEGPPDIAIEVAVSRSAIDKMSLYAGLGVPELWIWQDDRIAVYRLGKAGYREVKRSKLLPRLDVAELATFVRMPDQAAAAKAYWKRLQTKSARRG